MFRPSAFLLGRCQSLESLTLHQQVRHASIRAGVARGLRASGVEPTTRREVKRVKPRRAPNTGTVGQWKSPLRSPRQVAEAPFGRDWQRGSAASDRTRRSSSAGDEYPRSRARDTRPTPTREENTRFTPRDSRSKLPGSFGGLYSKSEHPNPFPVPYTTATSVFIPGRRATESILLASRRQTYNLYISNNSRSSTSIRQLDSLAKAKKCPVNYVTQDYIDRILNTLKMGLVVNDGVLLECAELTYTPVEALGRYSADKRNFEILGRRLQQRGVIECEAEGARWRGPLLLWMHEVVNTQNIAALYRSAIYFGVDAVVLTERGTGRIQPSALRASAGAVEFLPTLVVDDAKAFMTASKRAGWRFMGAMPPAKGKDSRKINVMTEETILGDRQPSVVILGNEDQGLDAQIKEACDKAVTIPAAGDRAAKAGIDSLNVSVAGTMLFSRLLQRPKAAEGGGRESQSMRISDEKSSLF